MTYTVEWGKGRTRKKIEQQEGEEQEAWEGKNEMESQEEKKNKEKKGELIE